MEFSIHANLLNDNAYCWNTSFLGDNTLSWFIRRPDTTREVKLRKNCIHWPAWEFIWFTVVADALCMSGLQNL